MLAAQMLQQDFTTLPELVAAHAAEQPDTVAIVDERERLTWREFNDRIDRVAARLQMEGVGPGDSVAIAAYNCMGYAVVFIAVLRTGAVAALLTSSATAASLAAMTEDSAAQHLFLDAAMAEKLRATPLPEHVERIALDDSDAGLALSAWMAPPGARPAPVTIERESPFNIIYSSGTTGTPKGIVQSHWMRLGHIRRAEASGYAADAIAIISTPLYSNTSLVSFIPALAFGGRVVLMAKFEAHRFLELAQSERATHAMLVPVQYRRIMGLPDFDAFDLSSFRLKTCTSAPFSPDLKAEVLRRWPGGLLDIYGMTEGGGSCVLVAHEFPNKLHTVGKPAEGQDIRLIGEDGREVGPGEIGEVVGRSEMMMLGYNNQPGKTREAEWYDAEGHRFIRHGDVGRFDEDGFLVLMDRAKDMIISGGFNIYPSDLEAELLKHPAVAEAAVVGVSSEQWGETPVAFVTLRDAGTDLDAVMADANSRLGRTQRVSAIYAVAELPRSQIGKVLKRELRDRLGAKQESASF
jgi:acyl-CoA synthetase (AMP-forming)/AMP-acid ligase II